MNQKPTNWFPSNKFEFMPVQIYFNPFIPVSAKTATSQVDLQVWKG